MTGIAKLTAASGASPSFEMKNRSAASKEKIATRPSPNGVACRLRWAATGPLVRSCLAALVNGSSFFRHPPLAELDPGRFQFRVIVEGVDGLVAPVAALLEPPERHRD